jgi:hypothetical protein
MRPRAVGLLFLLFSAEVAQIHKIRYIRGGAAGQIGLRQNIDIK